MEMDEAAAAEWQRGRQEAKALAEEHQRLRDAVVEAAIAWGCKTYTVHIDLWMATDALLAFERLYGLRERD